jgi:rsbT co-antagonist protein RsbR
MNELPLIPESSSFRRLQLSDAEVEKRRRIVDLGKEDITRILSIKDIVVSRTEELTAAFFDYLSTLKEAPDLFNRRNLLEDAKRLKAEHLVDMVGGNYGTLYVDQRLRLGTLYARAGLGTAAFLGAYHHLMRTIGGHIMKKAGRDSQKGFQAFLSLKKVGFLDISLIVDALIDQRERMITAQQDAMREMSTPVLQVRDRLLILPIIGLIDSLRAKQLTDGLLHGIRANRAKVAVMDITGVAAVDSKVANHLLQTVAAARLMGTTVIITGLSAEVAQALVALGVDLGKVNTVGDLQGGIEEAERILGYKVVPLNDAPARPGPDRAA